MTSRFHNFIINNTLGKESSTIIGKNFFFLNDYPKNSCVKQDV